MKNKSFLVLIIITLCCITHSFAQRHYQIRNSFAFTGGITKFNIVTDNFITKPASGFTGGIKTYTDFPHKWYNLSFGLQYSENNIEVLGRPSLVSLEEDYIDYKLLMATLDFTLHLRVIKHYFTIDVGPMLQYNGKLQFIDEDQEGYYVKDYINLSAQDITNISQFNVNGLVGATVGIRNLMVKAQYIYGFTNTLQRLNKEGLDTAGGKSKFKGHQETVVFAVVLAF